MSGAFKSYDLDISDNTTDGVLKKREHKWTSTLANQQPIRSCEHGCRSLILNVVKDTWVHCLRNPDCFYTRVAPRYFLYLLSTHSGGIEQADVVAMFATMHLWWAEYPRVP